MTVNKLCSTTIFNYLNFLNDIITHRLEILIALGHNAENYLLRHGDLQILKAICSLSLHYLSVSSGFPHIFLIHFTYDRVTIWRRLGTSNNGVCMVYYFNERLPAFQIFRKKPSSKVCLRRLTWLRTII